MKAIFGSAVLFSISAICSSAQDKPIVPVAEVLKDQVETVDPLKRPLSKDEGTAPDSLREGKLDAVRPVAKRDTDAPKWPTEKKGFDWGPAVRQSLMFLAVQHGYAMTQPKTRESLKGPFFKDYFRSVKSLSGWADGGKFFTNYVAHPMQGSFMGFVQVQNDPKGRGERFSGSGAYWKSRMKALAWSAAWSTQFEIGPISQASIGNVGLHGKQTYVDLVITPTMGTGMLVMEDILDRYLISRLERHGKYFRIFSRLLLNPTRTAANIMAFKKPWYRDKGLR